MRDFDQLPPPLRAWLANAVLPWRPKSVRRAYVAAYARTGDAAQALATLEELQAKRLAKDRMAGGGPRPREV